MSTADLAIAIGTFTAKSVVEGSAIRIVFTGEGDIAALPALEKLVKDLHAEALATKTTEVSLDVRDVSFMNSSCFTKLIGWVTRVRELAAPSRYNIRIKSNQQVLWQRRSLHALQCFAVDLITIES